MVRLWVRLINGPAYPLSCGRGLRQKRMGGKILPNLTLQGLSIDKMVCPSAQGTMTYETCSVFLVRFELKFYEESW